MNGYGKFFWPKNEDGIEISYIGHYENDLKHGEGKMVWKLRNPNG